MLYDLYQRFRVHLDGTWFFFFLFRKENDITYLLLESYHNLFSDFKVALSATFVHTSLLHEICYRHLSNWDLYIWWSCLA